MKSHRKRKARLAPLVPPRLLAASGLVLLLAGCGTVAPVPYQAGEIRERVSLDRLPFEVTITETGRTYPARVTAINARVDAVAQTVELEARMDSAQPDLLAGMSGIARFRIDP